MNAKIGYAENLSKHPELSGDLPFAWLEGTMRAELIRKDSPGAPDWKDIGTWPWGRIFGDCGEYRWQRGRDGKIHAVLILDEGIFPPGFDGIAELKRESEKDGSMMLWGEWIDPKTDPTANPDGGPMFYAPQLPRVQNYPLAKDSAQEQNTYPALVVRRYRACEGENQPEDFHGEFIRCVSIETISKGGRNATGQPI